MRRDQFGIDTEDGLVLAVVKEGAIGLTNAGLTRLVRTAVAGLRHPLILALAWR